MKNKHFYFDEWLWSRMHHYVDQYDDYKIAQAKTDAMQEVELKFRKTFNSEIGAIQTKSKYKFIVITKVPMYPSEGNLADDLLLFHKGEFVLSDNISKKLLDKAFKHQNKFYNYTDSETNHITVKRIPGKNDTTVFPIKEENFRVGELLVVDAEYEREISYPCRKPSKWLVEYKIFNTLDEAVAFTEKINNKFVPGEAHAKAKK